MVMLPTPSVDKPLATTPKRQWVTRTQVAANLHAIIGAIVMWPFFSDEPLAVQGLMAVFSGLMLAFGAVVVVVVAMHIVAKVARKAAPPLVTGFDIHVTAAAALAIAIWGLGHHWVREREQLMLRCVSEVEG